MKVSREDLAKELELAAEFKPYQEVDLHAKIAGYLKSISVDVGDRVRQGQVIGVLEVPEMTEDRVQATAAERRTELDVARAQSEVQRAESNLQIRELSYNRLASVAKARPNLVAQQEIDYASAKLQQGRAEAATARAALAVAEEQVHVSRASRTRVETLLRYLQITAPFSGVVTKRYADTGAMIQAGTASQSQAMPVVRIAEIDRLRLIVPVPESIVGRIHVGAPVEIRVDSLSRVFQGKVARFTGELNTSTRTMSTEVDVPNPNAVLKPGMFANATLTLDEKPDAVAVPIQAVSRQEGETGGRVHVINARNEVEARSVQLGMETPDKYEVLSGVKPGELVVIGARGNLRTGQRVQPKLNK